MKSTRGFTLLEVMAALMIFTTGVVGILALFASGLALHREAMQRSIVTTVSEDVRARLDAALASLDASAPSDALPAFEKVPIDGYPNYFYTAELAIDPKLGLAGGVYADVHVFTIDVGKEKGERFKLFVRPGAYPELQIRRAISGG